jgi:LmbE family N-acetylglucosaminyl deacetylase
VGLPLLLPRPGDRDLRILCLGAHSDDIEIGCGGTILTLLSTRDDVHVDWVVFSAPGEREREARASAERFLEGASGSSFTAFAFRDGFFPHVGAALKEAFESLKDRQPDVVFTHRLEDRHQDHRAVADLTWNTFRDHLVLEYEIPKYDGDLGRPNVFVEFEPEVLDRKVSLLQEGFPSQTGKPWFTAETFRGLARLRGIEAPGGGAYAEGFVGRKLSVRLGPT